MIETYQQEQSTRRVRKPRPQYATIKRVFEDGVSLEFDDEILNDDSSASDSPSKHYKVNTSCLFHKGDRVRLHWDSEDSGNCVVAYPVGNPRIE